MKIVALYCRVSTGRQEKEETIDSQIAEVEERIKQDGNVLGENLKFLDDGWSGDLLARPGLDQMRDSASKKEFEALYVWDRDRIARKYYLQELISEELQNLGIELIDLHSTEAKSPEDKILLGFKGLFAEYEKAKIAERMRRGKLFKAKSGKIVLGPGPFGYRYVRKTADNAGFFEINEEEAEVVRKLFKWIAEGLTIRKLIKRLYDLKLCPRKSHNEFWSNSTLCRLLRNEAYIGTVYYNKGQSAEPKKPKTICKYKRIKRSSRILRKKEEWIAIPVPSIIDKSLFYKVQDQLKINSEFSPRNKKHDYLLSGLVHCECGSRMGCEGGDGNYYYRCQNRLKRYPLPKDCFASGVNTERIDNIVWKKTKELIENPELLKQQAENWLIRQNSFTNSDSLEIETIKNLINKIELEEKRQAEAYGQGLLNFDLFRELIEKLKTGKRACRNDCTKPQQGEINLKSVRF